MGTPHFGLCRAQKAVQRESRPTTILRPKSPCQIGHVPWPLPASPSLVAGRPCACWVGHYLALGLLVANQLAVQSRPRPPPILCLGGGPLRCLGLACGSPFDPVPAGWVTGRPQVCWWARTTGPGLGASPSPECRFLSLGHQRPSDSPSPDLSLALPASSRHSLFVPERTDAPMGWPSGHQGQGVRRACAAILVSPAGSAWRGIIDFEVTDKWVSVSARISANRSRCSWEGGGPTKFEWSCAVRSARLARC